MDRNVGRTDRIVRVALGGVLAVGGLLLAGTGQSESTGALLAALGGVALALTGLAGRCGVYAALGKSTCDRKR